MCSSASPGGGSCFHAVGSISGPSGKLLRDPEVVESSGFRDIDAAAIKVAKSSRYKAGTEDGVPLAESCLKFKVKFVISER